MRVTALKACGIAWLPMADDGDGMFDDDVTVVQIRQMLAAPEFEHANQVETFFVCADPGYIGP